MQNARVPTTVVSSRNMNPLLCPDISKTAWCELIPPVTVELFTPCPAEWFVIIKPARLAIDPASVIPVPITMPRKIPMFPVLTVSCVP